MSQYIEKADFLSLRNFPITDHLTFFNHNQNFLNIMLPRRLSKKLKSISPRSTNPQNIDTNKLDANEYKKILTDFKTNSEIDLKQGNETFVTLLKLSDEMKVLLLGFHKYSNNINYNWKWKFTYSL